MLKRARAALKRRLSAEDGLESLEYAIITGLIVVAALVVLAAIGAWILNVFESFDTTVGP